MGKTSAFDLRGEAAAAAADEHSWRKNIKEGTACLLDAVVALWLKGQIKIRRKTA